MAHEVESMFYYGETPWHRLGVNVDHAPKSDEALLVAGLNWEVKSQQMYILNHTGEQVKSELVNGFMANVRQTDMSVLGVVKMQYTPLQNKEAFNFMDELLGEGLTYETAGSLQEGKRIFLTAKMPSNKILGDEVIPYVVMMNTHDGSSQAKVMITPIRVVCMNTLNMAMRNAVRTASIRHIGDIKAKIEEAKKVLNITGKYMNELEIEAEYLATIKLQDDKIDKILATLLPLKDKDKDNPLKIEQNTNQKNIIWERLKVDNLANHRNDGWGLLNAVADFADHSVTVKKQTQRSQEIQFEKIITGHNLLTEAHELVLASK